MRRRLWANKNQSLDQVKHFSYNGAPVAKLVAPASGRRSISLAVGPISGREADFAYELEEARRGRKRTGMLGILPSDGRMGSTRACAQALVG